MQDGVKYNEQLFIEVDLSFPVDRVGIIGGGFMDKSSFGGYCLVPIYFVVTAVDVLHDEHEEIVVFVGEIYERQYNVNERAVGVMAIEAYV